MRYSQFFAFCECDARNLNFFLKRLNQNENARVHKKLETKQLALQTAVAQILRADRNSWAKVAVGALVIVKDSRRRGYFLSLYSLLQHDSKPIWEEEIYDDMNIQMTRNFFLQFSGRDCQVVKLNSEWFRKEKDV